MVLVLQGLGQQTETQVRKEVKVNLCCLHMRQGGVPKGRNGFIYFKVLGIETSCFAHAEEMLSLPGYSSYHKVMFMFSKLDDSSLKMEYLQGVVHGVASRISGM